jgi:hypothetical protein
MADVDVVGDVVDVPVELPELVLVMELEACLYRVGVHEHPVARSHAEVVAEQFTKCFQRFWNGGAAQGYGDGAAHIRRHQHVVGRSCPQLQEDLRRRSVADHQIEAASVVHGTCAHRCIGGSARRGGRRIVAGQVARRHRQRHRHP